MFWCRCECESGCFLSFPEPATTTSLYPPRPPSPSPGLLSCLEPAQLDLIPRYPSPQPICILQTAVIDLVSTSKLRLFLNSRDGRTRMAQPTGSRKEARFGSSPLKTALRHPPPQNSPGGAAVQPQARRWVTSKTPLPAPLQRSLPPKVHPFQNQTLKPPPVKIDWLRRPLPYVTGDYPPPVDPNGDGVKPSSPRECWREWDQDLSTALRVTSTQLHHLVRLPVSKTDSEGSAAEREHPDD